MVKNPNTRAEDITAKVQNAEDAYESERGNWGRYYDLYRGVFDTEAGGSYTPRGGGALADWQSRANPNFLLADVEDKISIMMEGIAPMELVTSDPEAQNALNIAENALREIRYESQFDMVTEDLIRMSRIFGTAFRKISIREGVADERPITLQDEAISPFDITFTPGVKRLKDADWICHRYWLPLKEARKRWGKKIQAGGMRTDGDGEWDIERDKSVWADMTEVYEYWELDPTTTKRVVKNEVQVGEGFAEEEVVEEFLVNPTGTITWVVNDKVQEEMKNPYKIWPNFIPLKNIRLPDQVLGLGDIEVLELSYVEVLDTERRLLDKFTLECNPGLVYTNDSANLANVSHGVSPNAGFALASAESVMKFLEPTPMTNAATGVFELTKGVFDRMSGGFVIEPTQAAQMPGVALQIYNSIQLRRERTKKANLIEHLKDYTMKVLPLLDMIFKGELVPDPTFRAGQWLEYKPVSELQIRIVPGETPMSIAEDRQWAMAVNQVTYNGEQIVDDVWLYKHLHIENWEGIVQRKDEKKQELIAEMQEQEEQAQLGGGGMPQGLEGQEGGLPEEPPVEPLPVETAPLEGVA